MLNPADRPAVAATLKSPAQDLCLSFANTRFWRGTETPTEELQAPRDLLQWCAKNIGWDKRTLRTFTTAWSRDPAAGGAALADAIALREALYRCFAGSASAQPVASADLLLLNRHLARHSERTELRRLATDVAWAVTGAVELDVLIAPVLWSAADLLSGSRLSRVRRCDNESCQWLFLDDSKSGNRRWCAMSACGNRAKAHRHYAKVKGARAE